MPIVQDNGWSVCFSQLHIPNCSLLTPLHILYLRYMLARWTDAKNKSKTKTPDRTYPQHFCCCSTDSNDWSQVCCLTGFCSLEGLCAIQKGQNGSNSCHGIYYASKQSVISLKTLQHNINCTISHNSLNLIVGVSQIFSCYQI